MLTNEEYELVKNICAGDYQAFSKIVDEYKDLVYTLAYRMLKNREEAEEVSQDSFIKVFKALGRFKGDSKLSTWIYRITYNTCLDRIKQNKKKRPHADIDHLEEFAFVELNTALDDLVAAERGKFIRQCISKLPSKDAGILTLFYFEEKSLLEMEKILDIPASSIKVSLFRARKKMAKLVEINLKQEILD